MTVGREQLAKLLTPLVEAMGYRLWYLELSLTPGRNMIRIYLDSLQAEKGVTIDDCAAVSHQAGALIDVELPKLSNYVLEVSSCGLERGLFEPDHYSQYLGHSIKLSLVRALNNRKSLIGQLTNVTPQHLELRVDTGELVTVIWSEISKAKLVSNCEVHNI